MRTECYAQQDLYQLGWYLGKRSRFDWNMQNARQGLALLHLPRCPA